MQRCYKSAEYPGGMPFVRSRSAIMGEMARSLAHELNQPLGAIVTNVGAALRFLERDGDSAVRASVRDFGIGLPIEQPGLLFERFFSTKPEGMGIGLLITRSIVAAHGGTLCAESAQGGGAQFCVRLPASKEIGL